MNSLYDFIVTMIIWILVLGLLIGFFSTFWWLILIVVAVGVISIIIINVNKDGK